MSKLCETSGGKRNLRMFIDRNPKVLTAGVPSSQSNYAASDCFHHYLMQEEIDALISDSIHPPVKLNELLPLRRLPRQDVRNDGRFNQLYDVINPTKKTKFETLVQDLKETVYPSYWKKVTGSVPDPVPSLPQGFDTNMTLGKKLPSPSRLYDIITPKDPLPDKTPLSKSPGYQTCRNYCTPPYNPYAIFGQTINADRRGLFVKYCLTDDDLFQGTHLKKPINTGLANFRNRNCSQLGLSLAPNNNIREVPKGHTFGKLKPQSDTVAQCLASCDHNLNREFFKKCLAHLNSLRNFLAKRFEPLFFRSLHLDLNFLDKDKTGWLPRETVYEYCSKKMIHLDSVLIEPLLFIWSAFNGSQIKYETFIFMINFTQAPLTLPKVLDIYEDCIDFRTTYGEMVRPGQEVDERGRAGLPSGRYIDMDYPITPQDCCRADRICLSHESDVKACLSPSTFTLLGNNHRDMYAKREPQTVKRVFEAAGEKFSDEEFNRFWENAKKYHSQGWVSFETFRKSMTELESKNKV